MKRHKIEQDYMQPLSLLYDMFETIQIKFNIKEDEEIYRRIIEIFGDVCRLSPMPEKTREICDVITFQKIYEFIKESRRYQTISGKGWDYFGRLYESLNHLPKEEYRGCTKKKSQGINLTPEWLVEYINSNLIEAKKISNKENRPIECLDPACGTGRFLLDMLNRDFGEHQQIIHGVEKDLWLYRTCLINLIIYYPNGIWKVICADSLINDCMNLFLRSDVINQWNVQDWKDLPMLVIEEEQQRFPYGTTWNKYYEVKPNSSQQ